MAHLSPHEVKTGSTLTEDVYNLDGQLLFPAGTKLNNKKIEILMMWGVESVSLKGADHADETVSIQNFSNTVKHDAQVVIEKRFKLVKSSHPVVLAIKELAILESAKRSDQPNYES